MNFAPSTAILLVGGPARFNGVSIGNRAKAFLPIGNRPLYEYVASVLGAAGVTDLILCVSPGYQENLKSELRAHPGPQECLVKETIQGTGGSLLEVEPHIRGEEFWVVSGDLFLQADLSSMLAFHRERRLVATVGACRIPQVPWEMERVEVDANSRVKDIHRLHPAQEKRSTFRPAGLYLCNREILALIPAGRYFDLKEQLFTLLYKSGTPAGVWEIPGHCRSIASLDDYLSANQDLLLERVRFPEIRVNGAPPEDSPEARSGINPSSYLVEPLVIGPASLIGDKVLIIGPTAVGPNCEIEAGAILNQCVVLGNSRVGRKARLDRCVLGEGSVVPDGEVLHEMIVGQTPAGNQTLVPLNGHALQCAWLPQWHPEFRPYLQLFPLIVKRGFDVLIAAAALIFFTPIMLVIALASKLDSPGPIFFRQERCSRHGRRFTMYKFRTMVSNSEELKPHLQANNEVDGPMFKIVRDPRITRVGKLLRDSNLDELPQFWNVLKGDMSLTGPRPLSMDEMELNPKWRDCRLSVKPGLTGLWQVKAHSKLFFKDWVHYDIEYVHNFSLWSDLKILVQTLKKGVRDFIAVLRGPQKPSRQ